jgi:ABC-type polysaccharide/polyol phosphate transport system ATPase subunit
MKPAIRVTNLSKQYRLGPTQAASYHTLRDSLSGVATRLWQRFSAGRRGSPAAATAGPPDTIWALRDVSFDIPAGEVVGIIGGNGAGKSTLLKVLSRVTEPTSGRVEIRGRVGSLLEVGTGFHNELTGRENIFLSGAILGMTRREIARKFDAIAAFAEVEQFLDTPVKRYSSGMYVRLAFAVAAHLEPEILIVDEVLAVGDAQFQKKCLGKMEDVSRCGRTVFFVSHNMSVVQRLCNHVLFLAKGRLVAQGAKDALIARYLAEGFDRLEPGTELDLTGASRKGTREARFVGIRYTSDRATLAHRPYPQGPIAFTIAIESDVARSVASLGVTLCHPHGVKLVNADTRALGQILELRQGRNEFTVRIDRLPLNPGSYTLALWLANPPTVIDYIESAVQLEVAESDDTGPGIRPGFDGCVPCGFTVAA